ncbi:murein transglycosylase [Alphaproteobacteria bacterium]|nr:murein transglycosylase [Alphaproteobacteria bacterium]
MTKLPKAAVLACAIGFCAGVAVGAGGLLCVMLDRPKPPPAVRPLPAVKDAAPRWEKTSFAALPGWGEDSFAGFAAACRRNRFAWCDGTAPREYIEANFTPWRLASPSPKGLFTGYYTSNLSGARERSGAYRYPLLARPADLVVANVARFAPSCKACKGLSISGRVENGELVPYATRAALESRPPASSGEVLAWLADPVDAHILHIQGSGVVELAEGGRLYAAFSGTNGRPFTGIGSILRANEKLPDLTMPAVRRWLRANPAKASAYLAQNQRYVFFREAQASEFPVGAMGVPVSAGRTLAVDPQAVKLGTMLYLATDEPRLRRVVFAQDTGAAIKGMQRGDFYWGQGEEAFERAGRMKTTGEYYLLLPNGAAP